MSAYQVNRRCALKAGAAVSALAAAGCGRGDNAPGASADLAGLDAIATAQAIKGGELSAAEAVGAAIDRAEAVNPQINAIVSPYFDSAREQATQNADGPWFGVPSFIKDLSNVIGQRTAYGSKAFANNVAATQSDFVTAYLNTGMISLGKSATPEFGLTATTETSLAGDTRNPWDLNHSAGGSSGGAAALVASRVVPVAHASDGGGSIRIPASCCGLVGLKPSSFRFPEPERRPDQPVRLSEHGVVSRTVRDTAAFFAMMEVESDLPKVGLVEAPSTARGKIAVAIDPAAGTGVDPDVAAAVRRTADVLSDAGHDVVEIGPPFASAVGQDFILYWAAGAAQTVGDWEAATGRKASYNDFEAWTFGLVDYFNAYQGSAVDAFVRLKNFARDWRAAFNNFDVLLTPVLAVPPAPIGYLSPSAAFPVLLDRLTRYAAYTFYANLAGAPSISLPLAQSENGLPLGVMASAVQGGDGALIELAYELEEAMPWDARTPGVVA